MRRGRYASSTPDPGGFGTSASSAAGPPNGDVLYLSKGAPRAATASTETPEGHVVLFDASDEVIGITLINPQWLLERDGRVVVTLPDPVETSAEGLEAAMAQT